MTIAEANSEGAPGRFPYTQPFIIAGIQQGMAAV
jgi:hypothetical protein